MRSQIDWSLSFLTDRPVTAVGRRRIHGRPTYEDLCCQTSMCFLPRGHDRVPLDLMQSELRGASRGFRQQAAPHKTFSSSLHGHPYLAFCSRNPCCEKSTGTRHLERLRWRLKRVFAGGGPLTRRMNDMEVVSHGRYNNRGSTKGTV